MRTLLLTMLLAPTAWAGGFSTGNMFAAVMLDGEVQVQCTPPEGGVRYANWHCRDVVLTPAEYATFVHQTGGQADHVVLVATREDGSQQEKEVRYDARKGESKRINLWVSTLLQRPLLKMGRNQIEFTLYNGNKMVEAGEFDAMVETGGVRSCRRGFIYSSERGPCDSPALACQEYFQQRRYCQ